MKNVIKYYYNILFDDLRQTKENYYFDIQNSRYFFILYNKDISNLSNIYQLQNNLLKQNIYVHQIILNKDGGIITFAGNNSYILIKSTFYKEKINLNKIISFSNIIMPAKKLDYKTLWAEKNDNLEYQISQIGQRYPLIKESFNYFLGLAETSIWLLNEIKNDYFINVIAHERIDYNNTDYELYNPLNLIIDSRVRDITEYFKSAFFKGVDISGELNNFLNNANLMENEMYLFLARMFYPTYYFDVYENILNGNLKEDVIKKIIDKTDDYEQILKQIYINFKNKINFPTIEWLEII